MSITVVVSDTQARTLLAECDSAASQAELVTPAVSTMSKTVSLSPCRVVWRTVPVLTPYSL